MADDQVSSWTLHSGTAKRFASVPAVDAVVRFPHATVAPAPKGNSRDGCQQEVSLFSGLSRSKGLLSAISKVKTTPRKSYQAR